MAATDITRNDIPDAEHGEADGETLLEAKIIVTVLALVALWATSVATWGIPGLYIPALALVPVIWVVLLMISRI